MTDAERDERLARMMEEILIQSGTKVAWTMDNGYLLTTSGAYVVLSEEDMKIVKDLHTELKARMAQRAKARPSR